LAARPNFYREIINNSPPLGATIRWFAANAEIEPYGSRFVPKEDGFFEVVEGRGARTQDHIPVVKI
jgi:hypothetical protein